MYVQHGLPAIFHLISKLVQKGHFSSIYHPLSLVLLDGVFSNLLDLNWYCNDLISCSYMCIQFLDNHVMTFFFFSYHIRNDTLATLIRFYAIVSSLTALFILQFENMNMYIFSIVYILLYLLYCSFISSVFVRYVCFVCDFV